VAKTYRKWKAKKKKNIGEAAIARKYQRSAVKIGGDEMAAS